MKGEEDGDNPQDGQGSHEIDAPKNATETDGFEGMKVSQLQAKFAEVVGEATRSPNRTYLLRRIREEIAAAAPESTVGARLETSVQVAEAKDGTEALVGEAVEAGTPPFETAAAGPIAEPVEVVGSNPKPAVAGAKISEAEAPVAAPKLSKLDVQALQARYRETIGRGTTSENRGYLVWKIREAQKGNVPTGPLKSARSGGATFKVLPLRLESGLVDQLDEAWRRQGLASRMDLFRSALRNYPASVGEIDLAALLAER